MRRANMPQGAHACGSLNPACQKPTPNPLRRSDSYSDWIGRVRERSGIEWLKYVLERNQPAMQADGYSMCL